MNKSIKIGIAGAPSSGKTTLINHIRDNVELIKQTTKYTQIIVHREIAREYLESQLQTGLTLEEIYKDAVGMQKYILEKNVQLYKEALIENQITFFDTTIVDDGVFQQFYSAGTFEETYEYIKKYRYDLIFFAQNAGFVEKDGIRLDDVEENTKIGESIKKMYEASGYPIIELPTFLPIGVNLESVNKDIIITATQQRFKIILKNLS